MNDIHVSRLSRENLLCEWDCLLFEEWVERALGALRKKFLFRRKRASNTKRQDLNRDKKAADALGGGSVFADKVSVRTRNTTRG